MLQSGPFYERRRTIVYCASGQLDVWYVKNLSDAEEPLGLLLQQWGHKKLLLRAPNHSTASCITYNWFINTLLLWKITIELASTFMTIPIGAYSYIGKTL
jgi:hypothetical protein